MKNPSEPIVIHITNKSNETQKNISIFSNENNQIEITSGIKDVSIKTVLEGLKKNKNKIGLSYFCSANEENCLNLLFINNKYSTRIITVDPPPDVNSEIIKLIIPIKESFRLDLASDFSIGRIYPNSSIKLQFNYIEPTLKKDVSIHFTTKGQTVEEINKKYDDYFTVTKPPLFDFSESTYQRTVLHHCFLPEKTVKEKGFPNEIYDNILHSISEHKICWFGISGEGLGLVWDRRYMLENLKKTNGLAVFIGEIKEGVLEEFNLVKELEIDYLHIP